MALEIKIRCHEPVFWPHSYSPASEQVKEVNGDILFVFEVIYMVSGQM